jgi:hypothetical protein
MQLVLEIIRVAASCSRLTGGPLVGGPHLAIAAVATYRRLYIGPRVAHVVLVRGSVRPTRIVDDILASKGVYNICRAQFVHPPGRRPRFLRSAVIPEPRLPLVPPQQSRR